MSNWLFVVCIIAIVCLLLVAVIIIKAPVMGKDELDSILSEDLDPAEEDYYDRESRKPLEGCFFSFKMLAIGAAIYAVYHIIRFIHDWV